jgi:pimeloyl-ACP methyl ester carboxylesterase
MNTGSEFSPYRPVNTVEQNAGLAWTFIQDRMTKLNAHEVDIAAHSLGGVITRRMLHDITYGEPAQDAVRSVVLLGTPNGGSSCSDAWAVPANRELTHAAMETLYPSRWNSQIAPTAEKGTASITSVVLNIERVFANSSTKIRTNVMGTTILSRSLTRIMFSYCPLHCRT